MPSTLFRWQAGMALRERQEMDEPTVVVAMRQMGTVWGNLFPQEQHRIMGLLIERVQLHEDGLDIVWRDDRSVPRVQAGGAPISSRLWSLVTFFTIHRVNPIRRCPKLSCRFEPVAGHHSCGPGRASATAPQLACGAWSAGGGAVGLGGAARSVWVCGETAGDRSMRLARDR